ncbi:trehalase family glycosidase [uncultured Tenacibaculum sp.]|uniref:MGH1-like glycoside hydrolase domain-containing protein n=1 Tax=uncultured Tenacibaculum sp. TaxID=174713 RepID=UPI00262DC81E|nr:trehalase family glycosidase [uncultured Tenacibaculum sp.]
MNNLKYITALTFVLVLLSCNSKQKTDSRKTPKHTNMYANILDYKISPQQKFDKEGLMFSDQGAWFAYSFHENTAESIGFSGPFLMTQQNGIWLTTSFTNLSIIENDNYPKSFKNISSNAYTSHLEQTFNTKELEITQKLVFKNGHTALIETTIKNNSKKEKDLSLNWGHSPIFADGISFELEKNELKIHSTNSLAKGHLIFPKNVEIKLIDNLHYQAHNKLILKPNEKKSFVISQSFIFPEYSWDKEKDNIKNADFEEVLQKKKKEKETQLASLIKNSKKQFQDSTYNKALIKAHLTLQNNWRIPAGEIKHEGLFPSYHYKWFNGFWSWDSWKHAVGLSYYDTKLAKEQMRLMFHFQKDDGFIVDCVFRDTLIEKHNYRDTKPPLSAWAVSKIYNKDKDIEFVKEFYPKLKKYHQWWYNKRDHDKDGLCEYGSTDGSLIAAKWESGMDNAIRFDNSKILKNEEGAYSLNQESVDLNAYLYAEKIYLSQLATKLKLTEESQQFITDANKLKTKIQEQFYDKNDGWFYDTNLEGTTFIKGEGSEGWTALWANAATQEQAEAVKNKMMNTAKFYTKVPFQTMSADHPKFDPLKGYWRGPNWLDQSYFGVKSLRNYGFHSEADKATIQILKGAEGLLEDGKSIRENYHPLTGKGLHAKNFSWSAAHIIMLLQKD